MQPIRALGVVTLLASLVLGAASAQAQNADSRSCLHKAQTLAQAIAHHRNVPDLQAVRRKRSQAARECHSGFYRLGVRHYNEALRLLDTQAKG